MCMCHSRGPWISVKGGTKVNKVTIKTTGKKQIWTLFKEFINNLDNKSGFSRKELIESVYPTEVASVLRSLQTTVDQYRRYCCLVGFIEHTGTGQYRKLNDIPMGLTLTVLKKSAYDPTWRDWFIPPKEKIKAIEQKYK